MRNERPLGPKPARPAAWALVLLLFARAAGAGGADLESAETLVELSLEDLLAVELVTASRHEQAWLDTPASVHVLTSEDIRRSGARSLPELLRLVPGVHVARIDSHSWAVSARGFADQYADKLLVLIDGRSVYTPLYSGVFWDSLGVELGDVERVEVVRGPGASVWGANAVNGVINVITRSSADTVGTRVEAAAGEPAGLSVRHGLALGDRAHLRAWARHRRHRALATVSGDSAGDSWNDTTAGLRADWRSARGDRFTAIVGAAANRFHDLDVDWSLSPPGERLGLHHGRHEAAHALMRWERSLSARSELSLQLWADASDRLAGDWREERRQQDFELVLHSRFAKGHELSWGLGLRRSTDRLTGSFELEASDPRETVWIGQAHVQGELALSPRSQLTLGLKAEARSQDELELQPALRWSFKASSRLYLWAAASRAVRAPNRADRTLSIVVGVEEDPATALPLVTRTRPNPAARAEELVALEAGLRWRTGTTAWLQLDLFSNRYHDLRSLEPGRPVTVHADAQSWIEQPLVMRNRARARSLGAEFSCDWQVTRRWRLSGAWSWLELDFSVAGGAQDLLDEVDVGRGHSPRHALLLRSQLDLPRGFEIDATLHHVLSWNHRSLAGGPRLDLRLGWRPSERWELSFSLRDALEEQRLEFGGYSLDGRLSEAGRSAHLAFTWRSR